MVVAYHKINQYAEEMAALGRIDPVVALWTPFVLFAALILWMYWILAYKPGGQPIGGARARLLEARQGFRPAAPPRRRRPGRGGAGRMINLDFFPSKRIAFYMARIFVVRSLAVLAMLVLVLMTLDLLGEAGDILEVPGNGDAELWRYVSLRVPQLISRFLPFAVLLGTLITLVTLNQNSEVISMKAAGISAHQIIAPLVVASLGIAAVSLRLQRAGRHPRDRDPVELGEGRLRPGPARQRHPAQRLGALGRRPHHGPRGARAGGSRPSFAPSASTTANMRL